eukprot:7186012-Pyramimonas_sp.AAC.1
MVPLSPPDRRMVPPSPPDRRAVPLSPPDRRMVPLTSDPEPCGGRGAGAGAAVGLGGPLPLRRGECGLRAGEARAR